MDYAISTGPHGHNLQKTILILIREAENAHLHPGTPVETPPADVLQTFTARLTAVS